MKFVPAKVFFEILSLFYILYVKFLNIKLHIIKDNNNSIDRQKNNLRYFNKRLVLTKYY